MDRLRWVFELLDRASGPAKNVNKGLRSVLDSLEKLRRSTVRDPFRNATTGFERFVNTLHDGLGALKMVGGALGWVGGKAFDVASHAIRTIAFKESTQATFDMMLSGGKPSAESDAFFQKAVSYGALTPWSTETVLDSFKQLLGAGFKKQDVGILFEGLSDIAAASGFDENKMSMITAQLAQVQSMGTMNYADFKQITAHSGSAGIGQAAVLAEIAKVKGVSVAEARALVGAGGVTSEEGIFSFLNAIKTKYGQVGAVTLKLATTLQGKWSTLTSTASDFWLKLPKRAEDMGVTKILKSVMDNLISVFDASSERGQRFGAVMDKALTGLLEGVLGLTTGEGGLKRLEGLLDNVIAQMEKADWKAIGQSIQEGLKGAWEVLQGMATVLAWIAKTMNLISVSAAKVASDTTDLATGQGAFNPATRSQTMLNWLANPTKFGPSVDDVFGKDWKLGDPIPFLPGGGKKAAPATLPKITPQNYEDGGMSRQRPALSLAGATINLNVQGGGKQAAEDFIALLEAKEQEG